MNHIDVAWAGSALFKTIFVHVIFIIDAKAL